MVGRVRQGNCWNAKSTKRDIQMKQDPTESLDHIQEYRIELPIGVELTDAKRAAIERLDDHGFYSIAVTSKGIDIYIAWDGAENHLHNAVSELFQDFELVRIDDAREM